jgi:tetratricopeptide (TPR) repeat protein
MRLVRHVGLLVLLLSGLGCSSREQRSAEAFDRGNAAADRKDYDTAIAEFTEAIRLDPESDGAYHNRAGAYADKGEYARAIADYTEAIRLAPDEPASLTSRAWPLATCPDAGLRDGKRAVELAKRACQLSGWKDANDLENLAAACAECGQFDQAVKWQTRAIAVGTGLEDPDEADRRLELYKAGKPYHEK